MQIESTFFVLHNSKRIRLQKQKACHGFREICQNLAAAPDNSLADEGHKMLLKLHELHSKMSKINKEIAEENSQLHLAMSQIDGMSEHHLIFFVNQLRMFGKQSSLRKLCLHAK